MCICLGDSESDCLTKLRFADDVLFFSTSLEQLQRVMCDFKRSTEKVGLKIHSEKTKILTNQNANRRREVAINNVKIEVLPVKECAKYLGQTITFQQQKTTEIRSRIRAAWASFYIQTGFDIKIVPPAAQTSLVQCGDLSDAELCFWCGPLSVSRVLQCARNVSDCCRGVVFFCVGELLEFLSLLHRHDDVTPSWFRALESYELRVPHGNEIKLWSSPSLSVFHRIC